MGRSDFPEARSLRKNYTETAFLPPVVILNMLLLTVRWFCYWRKHQFLYHKFVVLFTHQSFNQMLLDYDDLMKIPFFKARTADLNGQVEKLSIHTSLLVISRIKFLLTKLIVGVEDIGCLAAVDVWKNAVASRLLVLVCIQDVGVVKAGKCCMSSLLARLRVDHIRVDIIVQVDYFN
ncbi:hypothetical protein P3L10_007488 [Capsicum annuum]|uniref:uncharacterized protein LOC107871358 n=1 Tax=Capsicum annuum TaxID=4072 RepID=UPI001FB15E45|nr:uncharacterized protein LOC107871358 [Capsicum annuum]